MTWNGRRGDFAAMLLVLLVAVALWIPRLHGPIDLRWDGGVYYLLGTSLAEGRGYRLLNEPGQIQAIQYPPLLPAIVAAHQRLLHTSDPAVVGAWLRLTMFAVFVGFAAATWRLMRRDLPTAPALLGTLLTVLSLHAWFLSNALYPELWFALTTTLFLLAARRAPTGASPLAYFWAVVSYAFRTMGMALFLAWIIDSLVHRRFREGAMRAALVAIPVMAWQGYVWSVERGDSYHRPAYEYQRAPYLFYNVSYATNIALRDPFTPEKGAAITSRRLARNLLDLPASIGEALTIPRGYYQQALHAVAGDGPRRHAVIVASLVLLLSGLGIVLVGGGALLRVWRGDGLLPSVVAATFAAMLLTPFPGQYLRYLMPIGSLLFLLSIQFLRRAHVRPFVLFAPVIALQCVVVATVYAREFTTVTYSDHGRETRWPMFFYDDTNRGFDEAVSFIQTRAQSSSPIVVAGTPHWVYLRTGLRSVMPPFESDAAEEDRLLSGVPADYLLVGRDVIGSERYSAPAVDRFPERWERLLVTSAGGWSVYRRLPDSHARRPSAGTGLTSR